MAGPGPSVANEVRVVNLDQLTTERSASGSSSIFMPYLAPAGTASRRTNAACVPNLRDVEVPVAFAADPPAPERHRPRLGAAVCPMTPIPLVATRQASCMQRCPSDLAPGPRGRKRSGLCPILERAPTALRWPEGALRDATDNMWVKVGAGSAASGPGVLGTRDATGTDLAIFRSSARMSGKREMQLGFRMVFTDVAAATFAAVSAAKPIPMTVIVPQMATTDGKVPAEINALAILHLLGGVGATPMGGTP